MNLKSTGLIFVVFTGLLAFTYKNSKNKIAFNESQSSEHNFYYQTNNAIEAVIKDEMIKQNLVGVAVGVIKDGRTIHLKSYGYTEIESKKAFTNQSVFRWASISKVVTAVAIHQLHEENKLKLNDLVTKHVSYWPTKDNKDKITIEQLLTHRSGIRHYKDYDSKKYKNEKSFDPKQSVAVFKDAALGTVPGNRFLYSTFGYNLLGAVAHEASPNGFEKWVTARIKNPLSLSSLTAYSTGIKGYDKICDDILTPTDGGKILWKLPGGGYCSNIIDLTKFMNGLINGTLLKNTAELWKQSDNGATGYGYGMRRGRNGTRITTEHGGAHSDMRTLLKFFTDEKSGICLAVNGGSYVNTGRLYERIAKAASIGNYTPAISPVHVSSATNCDNRYVSVWHNNEQETILRRGYSTNAFADECTRLSVAGYQCMNFKTYQHNKKQVWDGIFKKQTGRHAMWRNFDKEGFNKKWQEMSNEGYRLIDLETYMSSNNKKRLYAGLFVGGSGKYALFRGLDTKAFGEKRDDLAKAGYKLIDIEVYTEKRNQKWCGVWVAGEDGLLNRNYSTKEFEKLVSDRDKAGWKLIDVETYLSGSTRQWAGIWEKSNRTQEYLPNHAHDSTHSRLMNTRIGRRLEIVDYEKY